LVDCPPNGLEAGWLEKGWKLLGLPCVPFVLDILLSNAFTGKVFDGAPKVLDEGVPNPFGSEFSGRGTDGLPKTLVDV
jgi:hypothetical protein